MIITTKTCKRILPGCFYRVFCLVCACILMTSCAKIRTDVSNILVLPAASPIVVGPLANNSDTPLANRQVESMALGLLQAKGFKQVVPYKRQQSCEKLLYCPDETLSRKDTIQWARRNHATYVLTGATNEWRYKVGLDGEPVAGVSLVLIHIPSGRTIWTGVGSAIGGSRDGLDVIGQTLLKKLMQCISIK